METRKHSVTNLYTYIDNSRQMENLINQIESKENELNYMSKLAALYEKLGCSACLEDLLVKQHQKLAEVLRLKIKLSQIAQKLLESELEFLLED